ncbi:MAG: TolC family protein [Vicinamibacterales bacterium]
MNRFFRLVPAAFVALVIGVLVAAPPAIAQQQQPVSDARVKELMAQALAEVQNASQAPGTQDTRPVVNLTLEEAVRLATEKNIDLGVQRLNPQLQDLTLKQAKVSAYAPTYTSAFSTQRRLQQGTSTLAGGRETTTTNLNLDNSIAKNLPWYGTNFSVSWTNSRSASNSNNASYNPNYTTTFRAQVNQPLLRNFKIDAGRQAVLAAEISRDLADVALKGSTLSTLANARNLYWDLVYAQQVVEVTRQSVALAEKLVEDNRVRVEIGTLAPIDIVQAQAQAAAQRRSLVQAEAAVRTAELALKRLIVSGTEDPLWNSRIVPTDRPDPSMLSTPPIDIEAAVRTALANRTDLVTARENLRSAEINLKYLKNQTLPGLDLGFTLSASGTGGPYLDRSGLVGPVNAIVPGGYGDAFNILRRFKYPTYNLSLNFTYPIGNSTQEASLARARIQLQQSQAQIRASELRVATDVTSAALTVQSNQQQVKAAAAALELAQKQLEAVQSRFEVGMATNYEVIQAQRDLDSAQNSQLQAILNYVKSLVTFELVQQTGGSAGGASGG